MSEIKQKIITVDAKAFFTYFPKEIAEDQKCFTLKYANRALYKLVVQQENETEDCPLFHQFFKEIEKLWKENWYKDVFGKMRDLSKAHIFITESMFKGMKWTSDGVLL